MNSTEAFEDGVNTIMQHGLAVLDSIGLHGQPDGGTDRAREQVEETAAVAGALAATTTTEEFAAMNDEAGKRLGRFYDELTALGESDE